ncbi:aldo/keto reductase [Bifidobacterium choloepi]|uniref:Aldo/keto reductase n=1 Tax=Bifidobacterium choloepi TaxID=2614131 RepID=A0A6I5N0F1_9BIFI|nr:aldo/keto reductase [Bifidobacterium choloepi]NEG69129.1 aldo/keto reductase [Bifidobacterium choloepi]
MDYTTLANGVKMPMLGYGVYQIPPEETTRCVLDALEVGYRSIDTAQAYFNEAEVGKAIEESKVDRGDIFLTTKVWINNAGYDKARESILKSMDKLRTDYLDLCLIHQPFSDYYGTWHAMEDLYGEGRIRAIGVSNFEPDRLVDMCGFNRIKPMVNQVEINPLCQQTEAVKWMEKYGVQPEAWAPFGEGQDGLFTNPELAEIGREYGKTPAQVMLRWEIQRGIVTIPKSTHIERMAENFNVFDFKLSDGDMGRIASMNLDKSLFLDHEDPRSVETFIQLTTEQKDLF